MTQIRLRKRNQFTLPAAIATAANLSVNDVVHVCFVNGVITLTPIAKQTARLSITDFVGIAPGLWGATSADIDAHVQDLRDD